MTTNTTLRTVAEQQGAIGKGELLVAMNAASDQILDSYRTWVADDTEAKPRYGQIPRYDQLNAAITKLEIFGIASPQPANPAQDEPDFSRSIAEVIKEESAGGAACGWKSCSGCHETNEGAETGYYPYSKTFGCYVGSGCSECGGLGVVWEYWSEDALKMMADDAPGLANSEQVTDAMERVARMSFGYELMFEALCHIAGTSGGSTSWYTHKAQEITARVSPLHSLTADSNPEKPGDCKSQHHDFMRDFRAAIGACGQAVAVEPLIWPGTITRGQRVHNKPALVNYTIAYYGGDVGDPVYTWAEAHSPWSEPLPTYEAAKAAAQADYERRILSALSQPHPADERVEEALPRPDAVSMTCGTICLEYMDRDERDLAFDWLEAHGAGDAKEGR